jgi:hypothetical protein
MRKAISLAAAGLGAVTLAGAAFAATRDTHMLRVPLPDGSVAQVEYVGSVPPRVTVSPAVPAFTPFGIFDRSAFDMERQMDAMMRQISSMARAPLAAGTGLDVAAYGNAPAGSSSVTIVTTSNGSKTCTRRTEVDSLGAGKAPKVVSSLSGDCAGGTAAPGPQRNPT